MTTDPCAALALNLEQKALPSGNDLSSALERRRAFDARVDESRKQDPHRSLDDVLALMRQNPDDAKILKAMGAAGADNHVFAHESTGCDGPPATPKQRQEVFDHRAAEWEAHEGRKLTFDELVALMLTFGPDRDLLRMMGYHAPQK